MNIDIKCPKCGSENTERQPIEIVDSRTKAVWWVLVIIVFLGIAVQPFILSFCFVYVIDEVIKNILKARKYKYQWLMQCSRCKYCFAVVNPDMEDKWNAMKDKKKKKEEQKAIKIQLAIKRRNENLEQNRRLLDTEMLIGDIDFFGWLTSAFSRKNGSLRVTDGSLIWYNAKDRFRIPKDKILRIRKKNYLLFIPTGMQIKVNDRHKKYNFVVKPGERNKILNLCNSCLYEGKNDGEIVR